MPCHGRLGAAAELGKVRAHLCLILSAAPCLSTEAGHVLTPSRAWTWVLKSIRGSIQPVGKLTILLPPTPPMDMPALDEALVIELKDCCCLIANYSLGPTVDRYAFHECWALS